MTIKSLWIGETGRPDKNTTRGFLGRPVAVERRTDVEPSGGGNWAKHIMREHDERAHRWAERLTTGETRQWEADRKHAGKNLERVCGLQDGSHRMGHCGVGLWVSVKTRNEEKLEGDSQRLCLCAWKVCHRVTRLSHVVFA